MLPKNFEGNVLIIFNQKDDLDKIYENGKRLYTISRTGILKTKFSQNYGIQQDFFYEVGKNNKRTPLRYLLPIHIEKISKSSGEIFIYNLESVKDYDTKALKDRYAELFTVSTIKNLDSISNLKGNLIGSRQQQ